MAVEIINRERELRQLRDLAAAPPAFVVLYGRRRVGKSFLLRTALTGERVVSFQAEQKPLPQQLEAFARVAADLLPGSPPLAFSSWSEAFSFIEAQAVAGGPLTVVLDEFQFLAFEDPGIETTIQLFWDKWDHEQIPVMLVLSGSAISFMEGLFGGRRAMFGRSFFRPRLLPLSYRDAALFARADLSSVERVERFAVLGGTPQYQRWAGKRELDDVIRDVVLPPDAPLYSDPEHLLREERDIREPGLYFGTLEAIARGNSTQTKIAGLLQVKAQNIDPVLRRLQDLGYIEQVEPKEPGGKGRARAYWKILDPYFRFWFRYVFPNRSRLAWGRIDEVMTEIEESFAGFVGPIFEDCCREWLRSQSDLASDAIDVGSWWSRKSDVEVDVVALNKDGYTVIGSCKWWDDPVGVNVLNDLYEAKAAIGPKAAQARLIIFSKSPFTDDLTTRAAAEDVLLVRVDDLFPATSS